MSSNTDVGSGHTEADTVGPGEERLNTDGLSSDTASNTPKATDWEDTVAKSDENSGTVDTVIGINTEGDTQWITPGDTGDLDFGTDSDFPTDTLLATDTAWIDSETDDTASVDTCDNIPDYALDPAPAPGCEGGLFFPDENLAHAIREKLDLDEAEEITFSEAASITSLHVPESAIDSLQGIECLVNLELLDISYTTVTDLTPVTGLERLWTLRITHGELTDTASLSEMQQLKVLSMRYNHITDISPIEELTCLIELGFGGNEVTDISSIASLVHLEKLNLSENNISDLRPVSSLEGLNWLSAYNNVISDLRPLSELENLKMLDVSVNQISDLSPIASVTSLTTLAVDTNSIQEVNSISSLTGLEELYLSGSNLGSLHDLVAFGELQRLGLGSASIDDEDMKALSSLSLDQLEWLRLDGNSITSLAPLLLIPSIMEVYLQGNPVVCDDEDTHRFYDEFAGRGGTFVGGVPCD